MSCGGGWIVLEWFCVRRGKKMFGKRKRKKRLFQYEIFQNKEHDVECVVKRVM